MSTTTFSKSQIFRVTVEVDELRLKQMRKAPELAMQAMQVGADYWHSGILPKHFVSSAHSRYGYAQRAISTLKMKGSKPDLVNKGSLRDDVKSKASFQQQGRTGIQLKMSARVLNLVPNMSENSFDDYVTRSNGNSYPNLKREIKAITEDEREAIAQVIASQLEVAFAPTDQKNASKLATEGNLHA